MIIFILCTFKFISITLQFTEKVMFSLWLFNICHHPLFLFMSFSQSISLSYCSLLLVFFPSKTILSSNFIPHLFHFYLPILVLEALCFKPNKIKDIQERRVTLVIRYPQASPNTHGIFFFIRYWLENMS